MYSRHFAKLIYVLVGLILVSFIYSELVAKITTNNWTNVLSLHAVSVSDKVESASDIWKIACDKLVPYEPHLQTTQMAQSVVSGTCFSLDGLPGDVIHTIKPEHRYWLAVSATAGEQDFETELWQSLNFPVEYFFIPAMEALSLSNLTSTHYWCRLAHMVHPQSARTSYCMGRVAQVEGRWAEAIDLYQEAATAEQDLAHYEAFQLYSRLGHLLLDQLDQAEEAHFWLERAIEMQVDCCVTQVALVHNRVGRILEMENDVDGAFVHYQQAVMLDESNPWFWRDAGRAVYRHSDDWQLTQSYLTEAMVIAAGNPAAGDSAILWLTAARPFLDTQHYHELLPLLANAPDSVRSDRAFAELYAQTAYMTGEQQLCLTILEEALKEEADHNEIKRLQSALCSSE
jgi:tetratricopeptide (TPR) repeat protein